MTSFTTGRQGEAAAATYLEKHGFRVMEQNFRTRTYEIDIIAVKDDIVYFVEVKYRHSDDFGSGLEYITPRKLKQMQYAAELWLLDHQQYEPYRLAGLEVSGPDYKVTNFIDSLT